MMKTAPLSAREILPITPDQVAEIASEELAASIELLTELGDSDWDRPTECSGWSVHGIVAHLVGQYQGLAKPGMYLRRHWQTHRRYPAMSRLDAHNRLQIDELGGRPGPELVAMLANIGPKAIRSRQRVPGLMRRQHIGRMYPEEPLADDRLGYMLDVLGLRDPWMHRIDVSRATGRQVQLGEHDREIVGQVVRDLARAWDGPALHLELTGPAGGRWMVGAGAPAATAQADTIDYLRSLSGRSEDPDLQADGDPAAIAAAIAARVVF